MNIHELITDTDFYNSRATYARVFRINQITEVSQLLDADILKKILKKPSLNLLYEVKGFIAMLKYRYCNEPLSNVSMLDGRIDFVRSTNDYIYLINDDESEERIGIRELLGVDGDIIFKKFLVEQEKNQYYLPKKDVKIIDFLQWVAAIDDIKCRTNIAYANAYIESYEKNMGIKAENDMVTFKSSPFSIAALFENNKNDSDTTSIIKTSKSFKDDINAAISKNSTLSEDDSNVPIIKISASFKDDIENDNFIKK